jgi:hypothetical protein
MSAHTGLLTQRRKGAAEELIPEKRFASCRCTFAPPRE